MKNANPTKVGGQAILEGIMMRGARAMAIAIRLPNDDIHITVEPIKEAGAWKKIPIVRGVVAFISSLVMGTDVLTYSAEVLEEADKDNPAYQKDKVDIWIEEHFGEKAGMAIALVISVVLAIAMVVGIFILLPTVIMDLFKNAGINSPFVLNLIEGILRIIMFVIYVLLITLMPEIKRTFEYHGAEHKTIHCYENGLELTPENAQTFYTLHPRCGTSFLMFVMIISLLVFSFFGWPNLIVRVVSRLLLIPVIAGISYELLQFTGRHNSGFVKACSLPGISLQLITTKEPSLKQLEVAIAATKQVLPSHEDPNVEVNYWVGVQKPDGTLIKDEEATNAYIARKNKK
ncbi:MAG: DUF1385 domain-containing protein [Bacillota bacterium]|nr:DUF1385 domain-containing protein [Bacillota bacterium]